MNSTPDQRMFASKPCVAIVGAGFSGYMVAIQLLRASRQPLRIRLIDPAPSPGRGLAYRKQPECHLLNVRAEALSAFPDRPEHFIDWVRRTQTGTHTYSGTDYLPRKLYGDYLESLLEECSVDAYAGVELEYHRDEVLALGAAHGGFQLRLQAGTELRADFVVLALGNPGPADPAAADSGFRKSSHYLGDAWSSPGFDDIGQQEDILLVGSGLTALDWLSRLHERRHAGRIYVVSRRGLLPQIHQPAQRHTLSFDPATVPGQVRSWLRQVRMEARLAAEKGLDWRAVIDALRPHTQSIWQRWPQAEQKRFLRHLRPYWETHRHRAAPRMVGLIQDMLDKGQLRLIAGRTRDFSEHAGRVTAEVMPRRGREVHRLEVQHVVNCTGPECDYRRLNHPLLIDLRRQGLIEPDALGLGLRTDRDGALIGSNGQISQRLLTLGPTRKGELWETTAIPEIRVQAQTLSRHLLDMIERVDELVA